jgi:membrane-associated phospholipid phosphatase
MSSLTPLLATLSALLLQVPLQGPLPEGMLGQAIIAVLAIGVVVLVGRIVLNIAWKLVLIASVVVGALWLVTTFL